MSKKIDSVTHVHSLQKIMILFLLEKNSRALCSLALVKVNSEFKPALPPPHPKKSTLYYIMLVKDGLGEYIDILAGGFSLSAGHCCRSKDELISDVLLWTPTYGCAKVGRPARTYIQQLCEDTGCNPEDLPEAMNDREKWRERVRDIRAGGAT